MKVASSFLLNITSRPPNLVSSVIYCSKHSLMSQTIRKRGAFILFEGTDRSGKTTQCTKLVELLKSKSVDAEVWRFPDRTTYLGKLLNSYLSNSEESNELSDAAVHLMFAANRWERSQAMLNALSSGTSLVVDRYSYSGMAYTLAKQIDTLDDKWCRAPEVGLPAPDIVFYMKSSPSASALRGGFGEERYEKAEFQKLVSAKFDALAEENWMVIDADQSIEEIHKQISEATEKLLSSDVLQQPISRMYSSVALPSRELGDGEVSVSLPVISVKGMPNQGLVTSQADACIS